MCRKLAIEHIAWVEAALEGLTQKCLVADEGFLRQDLAIMLHHNWLVEIHDGVIQKEGKRGIVAADDIYHIVFHFYDDGFSALYLILGCA